MFEVCLEEWMIGIGIGSDLLLSYLTMMQRTDVWGGGKNCTH